MRIVIVLLLGLLTACVEAVDPRAAKYVGPAPPVEKSLALPNRPGSIKFAAIGDGGRGDKAQQDVADQMVAFRRVFDYDFVVMLGDNIYDGGTRQDYLTKFERPYRTLLEDEVEFYAAIGNHDSANQVSYPAFHMGGERYYTFKADQSMLARLTDTDAQFFMIDTEILDRAQVAWLDRELERSQARWKIAAFHRPIYTSGRYAKPARIFRAVLEPLFIRHGVAAGLSGHEHFYQRTTPQQGITYFISGGAGSLRRGDIRRQSLVASGFDIDQHFMLFEITRDELFYQAISRTGHSIDAGSIKRE